MRAFSDNKRDLLLKQKHKLETKNKNPGVSFEKHII
jgi:hypothetical protein